MTSLPYFYDEEFVSSGRKEAQRRDKHLSKKDGGFQVKKRVQYENEVLTSVQSLSAIPLSYGDRFIPRRYFRKQLTTIPSLNLSRSNEIKDIFDMKDMPNYWRYHNYQINLSMSLGLNDDRKLLNLHDATTQQICRDSCNNNPSAESQISKKSIEQLDWDCKPRAKPLAYNDSTHDMPGFDSYNHTNNIIDWNCLGQIAACFDQQLVLWGPPEYENDHCTMLYDLKNIHALKYRSCGKILALSVNDIKCSWLQIWDVSNRKSIFMKYHLAFEKEIPFKSIRSIEWDMDGKRIICGDSSGVVHAIKYPEMSTILKFENHKSTIIDIKFSINSTFIAIVDNSGKLSIIRDGYYKLYHEHSETHFIAWHPWNEMNLFIGTSSPAAIYLLDLKTKSTISHYRRTDTQYSLCAMTINPLSAELVASFMHKNNESYKNYILVLASMNRIVDNLSAHENAVHFLLWDSTGTRIATAGQDESLNIWHFFGRSQKAESELKRSKTKSCVEHSKLNIRSALSQFR